MAPKNFAARRAAGRRWQNAGHPAVKRLTSGAIPASTLLAEPRRRTFATLKSDRATSSEPSRAPRGKEKGITMKLETKSGRLAAAVRGAACAGLAGAALMIADEYPDFGARSPITIGGTPVALHLYVADVDAVVTRAEAAGATVLRAPKDEFFGHRVALLVDPFGHRWHLATRKELLTPSQMQERMEAAYK